MSRIVKDGTERKREFVDTALHLFLERGYERTSINTIIEAVGVTKGAFYHYFKSKEEILDCITDEYAENFANGVLPIYEDPDLNALEKLNQGFLKAQLVREEHRELLLRLFGFMNRDENLLFRKRFTEKVLNRVKQSYTRMIYQGISEGIFQTEYPEEVADLIINMGSEYRSKIATIALSQDRSPFFREEIFDLIDFLSDTVEKILGLESNALKLREGFEPYL